MTKDREGYYSHEQMVTATYRWADNTPESITAACALETVKVLRLMRVEQESMRASLRDIRVLIDQLGADGIHTLIKEEARRCRKIRARRKLRETLARRKARALRKLGQTSSPTP